MVNVKNVVVEVVRDEDGLVGVKECGVSDYEWFGFVMMEGGFNEGGLSDVERELNDYVKGEVDDGWVDGIDWEGVKKEFMEKVVGNCDESVVYIGWSGYGVECDSNFVVMVCKG